MSLPPELQPLCRELDQEKPRVLVVVGAGVSFGATGAPRASWRGLLEHGVETLRKSGAWDDERSNANLTLIRNAFRPDFDLDEVLGRAESIAKALGAPDGHGYAAWLEDAIGSLRAVPGRTATLDAIEELQQAGALVLTTNYDQLLSEATTLDAVTWLDHRQFLRVLNREREAILHLHGHWRQPSSVILGRRSYDSILSTAELQHIFRSIWLQWTWLYVGCGSGLDNPNVGQLLQWGHNAFGAAAPKQYFLGLAPDVDVLASRPDKPANLIAVGYADHTDLPDYLRLLTPRRRPQPFIELGPTAGPVRQPTTSPLDVPLPSWQELLTGAVPALAADADVTAALRRQGWALVYDVASVGKTTLALRLAAGAEYRDRPAFYLDMARTDGSDEDEAAAIRGAVRRLAHTNSLVILDNAHWAPQLIREVWEWWLARPRTSRLLLLATRIQHTAGRAGDDALTVVEHHPAAPPIMVRPRPTDLIHILNYIVARYLNAGVTLRPPDAVLAEWYAIFAVEMGAFAAAVTNRCHALAQGNWDLPASAAVEWMRRHHLARLKREEQENLVCLAVFAVQELELDVADSAMPHPNRMAILIGRGLVERRERGLQRHLSYRLRETDWGALLLAAVDPPPDAEGVLLVTTCRHAIMTLVLSSRLSSRGDNHLLVKLWRRLEEPETAGRIIDQLMVMPLHFVALFIATARAHGRAALVEGLWAALEAEPAGLATRALETPLHFVASFIETARAHGRAALVEGLWAGLEAEPARLAARALETPLGDLASFIETARVHGRAALMEGLWATLEAEPARLAARALETPLHFVASFIETARAHGRAALMEGLWATLEAEPARLAARALETPLGDLASFIETARAHGRAALVEGLWAGLEAEPARLAARALETPLGDLASFIETARAHGRAALVEGLWAGLEAEPARLAARALETPLHFVASFIETARAHGRAALVEGLWAGLETEPARLAARALETPLGDLASFIETARAHGRAALVEGLWATLEAEPARLATLAFETPLDHLASFIEMARAHERTALAGGLWATLEGEPARLATLAFETPLDHLASFIETAGTQGRAALVEGLWAALEGEPARLQNSAAGIDGASLRGFLLRAPEAIGRLAIARLDVNEWASGGRRSGSYFPGAPRLATQFANLGREDLAAALRDSLLHSADLRCYQFVGSGLLDVAILLNNTVAVAQMPDVEAFAAAVCTPDWLSRQYTGTYFAPLAGALVLLGLSQPPAVLRRFWSSALTKRVETALVALRDEDGEALRDCVQFLGAAQLIGRRMPRAPFAAARLDRIGRLPVDVLPHRAEAVAIEPYQRNLWLGLRAVASLAPTPLPVDQAVIAETLARWRISLKESAADLTGTVHRLNQSMVAWLEASASGGTGALLPCNEPLWVIPGFGWDPYLVTTLPWSPKPRP